MPPVSVLRPGNIVLSSCPVRTSSPPYCGCCAEAGAARIAHSAIDAAPIRLYRIFIAPTPALLSYKRIVFGACCLTVAWRGPSTTFQESDDATCAARDHFHHLAARTGACGKNQIGRGRPG